MWIGQVETSKFKMFNVQRIFDVFYLVGDLRRHEQHTHIDLKTCDICGQDGMSIYNLKIHMKIHDENRERSFSCDECGMSFHRERGLKNHMMSHSEDKPYACDVCHKQFKYKNSLVTHLKLHNEDLPRVKVCIYECFIFII